MPDLDPLDVSDMLTPAVVPPIAAFVIVAETDAVRVLQRKARALAANGQVGVARQLAMAAEFLLRAHRAHRPVMTSDVGTTELPMPSAATGLTCPPTGLTTGEVAERLRVTDRWVIKLIHKPEGGLSATWFRGRWWIDTASVLAYEEAAREERVHDPGGQPVPTRAGRHPGR